MKDIYSIFIYEKNFNKRSVYIIFNYIKKGIKVYYLTNSTELNYKDLISNEDHKIISSLKRNYMLSINFEVYLPINYNYVEYEDGDIHNSIVDELKKSKFNFEQYKIEHLPLDNHVVVKAGAGTGKTKTMIDRSIFLRHKNYCSFKEMVMITFTNKSAIEMKSRLSNRLEEYYNITKNYKYLQWVDEISEMRIQTIHSFSKGFLEIFGDKIGIDRNSKIKSLIYERYKFIEDLINEYRFKSSENFKTFRYIPQYRLVKSIMKIENYIVTRGIDITTNFKDIDFGKDEFNFNDFLQFILLNLSNKVNKHKEENSVIEISDLVAKLREFVKLHKTLVDENIKYIMVDEFQDTDSVQVEFIIWLINNFKCKSFIVGDIKQSIYRFRGANYTAFKQFEEELKNVKIDNKIINCILSINYRSDYRLIDDLNNFFYNISNIYTERDEIKYFNFNENDKLKGSKKYNSEKVLYKFNKNNDSIEDNIAVYIRNIAFNRNENEDIGVLVRTNKDLENIVERLELKGLVCKKEITGSFYRSIAIREFYIMLKALIYPKVALDQYALINSSYGFGIGNDVILNNFETTSNYLEKIILKHPIYLKLDYFRKRMISEPFLKVLKEIIEEFKPNINFAIKRLRERIGIISEEELLKRTKTIATNYQFNILHLFTILDRTFSGTDSNILNVLEFIGNRIQTDNTEDEKMLSFKDGKYDVQCMTIHKSKGLEFDHVVLPDTRKAFLNKGTDSIKLFAKIDEYKEIKIGYNIKLEELDIKNNIYDLEINEENREVIAEEIRLLYVALTRAKKAIHIYKNPLVSRGGEINNWMKLIERGQLFDE